MRKLQVYLNDIRLCQQPSNEKTEIIEFAQLVYLAKSKSFLKKMFRYQNVILWCNDFNDLPTPFLSLCICRLMTFGRCKWINANGKVRKVGICRLTCMAYEYLKDKLTYKKHIYEIQQEIDKLAVIQQERSRLCLKKKPLYLRLDLTWGLVAGGSVGHIAGVVNNLNKICKSPIFVSTDNVPTIQANIKKYIIKEKIPFRNVTGVSAYMGNLVTYPIIEEIIDNDEIAFIYQRSGLDIYAGVKAAIEYNLPYVLEYNGSEIWCEEHWGNNQLRYVDLAKKIERLTFEKADLITCVSRPLKEQLVEMGIQADKIMVNPNGVDPDKYRPDIDGRKVRKKYGIEEAAIVIGFIGTFGAWHGAELLASAYVNVVKRNKNIHLLMIGDGLKLSEVKENLQELEPSQYTLTGLIPQVQGPEYLAACDILVNPTVPNPDGTPFFGSPTKLFEYMAMGKAVVASGMDQMQEVLEQGRTALLVEPGNVLELEEALNKLVEDKELRCTLGINARKQVCEHYTWEIHTKKIIDKLIEIMER